MSQPQVEARRFGWRVEGWRGRGRAWRRWGKATVGHGDGGAWRRWGMATVGHGDDGAWRRWGWRGAVASRVVVVGCGRRKAERQSRGRGGARVVVTGAWWWWVAWQSCATAASNGASVDVKGRREGGRPHGKGPGGGWPLRWRQRLCQNTYLHLGHGLVRLGLAEVLRWRRSCCVRRMARIEGGGIAGIARRTRRCHDAGTRRVVGFPVAGALNRRARHGLVLARPFWCGLSRGVVREVDVPVDA